MNRLIFFLQLPPGWYVKDDAEAPRRALQRVQRRAKNSAEQMVRSLTAHTTITAAVFSPASLIFFPPCKR